VLVVLSLLVLATQGILFRAWLQQTDEEFERRHALVQKEFFWAWLQQTDGSKWSGLNQQVAENLRTKRSV
jgi:hypothetical protein